MPMSPALVAVSLRSLPALRLILANRMADDFYVRYYVGHKGKFGHGEHLEKNRKN